MFDHCLYFNTTALARVVEREWAAAFKPFGLTPPQGFLLRLVLARPGLSQHELATELTIARPTATRLLDGLQTLGLVERRDAAHDARHWSVFPTAAAQRIQADLNAASSQVTQRIQRQIGKENFTATVSKVRGVCSALK
ncbi:MAG: MarR family winged helix-turn-helix transcriptional regulator [Polaromonas sp.]|uniref:MarR family winged helix-turn-helix transcriptional regulator n=1 Tax=Polaromonas sp. TaxID=1869339 RepID=UPI0040354DA1